MRLVLLSLVLAACGSSSPGPGVECLADAGPVCANSSAVLVCELGVWRSYECPGPKGCGVASNVLVALNDGGLGRVDLVSCDPHGREEGKRCPQVFPMAWCGTGDSVFSCVGADGGIASDLTKYVTRRPCNTPQAMCSEANDSLACF